MSSSKSLCCVGLKPPRNLDHRKERWDFMQRQFLQLKMPVERFSAVNGRELDVPELAMQLAMRKMEGMAACGECGWGRKEG